MDAEPLNSLPGAEIVLSGIADLRSGRESVNASAVQSARSRLLRAGLPVPPSGQDETPAAHRLYERLAGEVGDGAHARYNAILARVDSFARAAEIARAR
jgi:hypothetical protein